MDVATATAISAKGMGHSCYCRWSLRTEMRSTLATARFQFRR